MGNPQDLSLAHGSAIASQNRALTERVQDLEAQVKVLQFQYDEMALVGTMLIAELANNTKRTPEDIGDAEKSFVELLSLALFDEEGNPQDPYALGEMLLKQNAVLEAEKGDGGE
jgi:hypothetical protein